MRGSIDRAKLLLKRIDHLVIAELLGPWFFGVAMFTVLIMAGTYLNQVTDFLVKGAPPLAVVKFVFLLLPGVLVKTFAMAMLLAGLLGFGRLSSDSEIVAMRAAGASIGRIILPVLAFASVIAVLSFFTDETVVPWGASRAESLVVEIAHHLDSHLTHPASQPIIDHGKVIGDVSARDFDATSGVLREATVVVYNPKGGNSYYLWAKRLAFDPTQLKDGGGWGIQGGAVLLSGDGTSYTIWDDKVWPPNVPKPSFTPQDIVASLTKHPDILSMRQIRAQIIVQNKDPNHNPAQVANLEFGYWNKVALPLDVIVFGLLGAPLGINNRRTSAAGGFALAVAIIFGYITLANFLSLPALEGLIPPWSASLAPVLVGIIAALVIIVRRNR